MVVSSQVSFRSCQIFFMSGGKPTRKSSPANEAEGQNTSRTTLLENGRDSETSTARESSTDIDVNDVDLEISSFWPHKAWFQKMSGERGSLKSNNIIPITNTTDEIF